MMASAGGAVAGNLWHAATHAEHARPMMQASLGAGASGQGGTEGKQLCKEAMRRRYTCLHHGKSTADGLCCCALPAHVPPDSTLTRLQSAPVQVSGEAFLQCLKLALDSAPNMHQALQVGSALLLLGASPCGARRQTGRQFAWAAGAGVHLRPPSVCPLFCAAQVVAVLMGAR